MDFGNYTEGASLAVDLTNTLGSVSGREHLPDVASLAVFLERQGFEVPEDLSEADLAAVKRVRARLREVFFAESEEETAELVNRLLRENPAKPHLTNHDGDHWHVHFAAEDDPLACKLACVAGMALAMAMHESGRKRLGVCSADDCLDVFIDTSRNRSRRYCDDSCSSRTNVAAYRARQRA